MDPYDGVTVLQHFDIVIISRILKYTSDKQTLKLRNVSRLWNESFYMNHLHRFTVGINDMNGSNKDEDRNKLNRIIDSLLGTTGHWQRLCFNFVNLNTNSDFVPMIETCFNKFQDSIESIQFLNCEIPMSTFIQLLSIPKRLSELRVINSTGCYSGGLEVIRAHRFMIPFRHNMANLRRVQLNDSFGQCNPLGIWLNKSNKLVELRSEMSGHPIDNDLLQDILCQNSHGLNNLSFAYIHLNDTLFITIVKLRLKHFSLRHCDIPKPTVFYGVLQQQVSLQTLSFNNIIFKNLCLSFVGYLHSLKSISFQDCEYETSVLAPFRFVNTLVEVVFIGKPKDQDEVQIFLNISMPSVKTLVLQLGQGTDYLFKYVAQNLTNLKSIDVTGSENVNAENLFYIWTLKNLQKLFLNNCNFSDVKFVNQMSISDLEELRVLDLSNTNINDDTIKEIVKLKKIKHIIMQNTQITEKGLSMIVFSFLYQLKTLDVTRCTKCIISEDSFDIYNEGLKRCALQCDLDDLYEEVYDTNNYNDKMDDTNGNQKSGFNSDSDSNSSDDNDVTASLELISLNQNSLKTLEGQEKFLEDAFEFPTSSPECDELHDAYSF